MRCSIPRPVIRPIAAWLLVAGVAALGAARAVAPKRSTPDLLDAIRAVDAAGVRAALDRGADVTATEPDGTTPLHWAVHADDADIVELVLEAGADAPRRTATGWRPSPSPA